MTNRTWGGTLPPLIAGSLAYYLGNVSAISSLLRMEEQSRQLFDASPHTVKLTTDAALSSQ